MEQQENPQVLEPTTEVVETPQSTQGVVEENQPKETNPVQESGTLTETPVEGVTTEVNNVEGTELPKTEETPLKNEPELSDDIKAKLDKLKEYELNNQEIQNLRNRLGVQPEEDNLIFSAKQQLAVVENQIQQEYIKLCNSYGVDFRPDKIEESAEVLKQNDPKAYYELEYKLRGLSEIVNNKRSEVDYFIWQRDTEMALARNQKILNASPAINRIVQSYISQGAVTGKDIDLITQYGVEIAREAIEMGKQLAMQEFEKKSSPAKVLNNNSIVSQTQVPTGGTKPDLLTLERIKNMTDAEYIARRDEIDKFLTDNNLL